MADSFDTKLLKSRLSDLEKLYCNLAEQRDEIWDCLKATKTECEQLRGLLRETVSYIGIDVSSRLLIDRILKQLGTNANANQNRV
jgi:uncharacterized ferritin-like protein (DUF455 family)